MRNLLVKGNSTMPKSVGIFNLPAEVTCTPSPWCQKHCYAKKGRFCWSNVSQAYYRRLEATYQGHFVNDIIREISKQDRKTYEWKHLKYVRVHISGDFYSREYVMKWASIASKCPKTIFRTNTRRRDLLMLMKKIFPDNFVVRESTDPTRRPIGFFPQAAIPGTSGSEDFFECCNDCMECGFLCWLDPKLNVRMEKVL
jgi:hypothetical protein